MQMQMQKNLRGLKKKEYKRRHEKNKIVQWSRAEISKEYSEKELKDKKRKFHWTKKKKWKKNLNWKEKREEERK